MERRKAGEAREVVAIAAASLFAEHGYARTSVRDIASEAGVDPAIVIRHFGSKEQLFLDTMRLELAAQPLAVGPIETVGERFVEYLLGAEDQVKGVYLALIRASDAGEISSHLREAHEIDFVAPLRERLTGPDADLRARLAAALVGGLLYSLWVVRDQSLLAADPAEVTRRYGALLQRLITP